MQPLHNLINHGGKRYCKSSGQIVRFHQFSSLGLSQFIKGEMGSLTITFESNHNVRNLESILIDSVNENGSKAIASYSRPLRQLCR